MYLGKFRNRSFGIRNVNTINKYKSHKKSKEKVKQYLPLSVAFLRTFMA